MARPKTIPDEQVLDTLLNAIMECGPDGLTFARAAKACGLSPATLVQRYGTREKLVQAVLMRAWDRLDAETGAADAEEAPTPVGAINLLMRLMPHETAERDATNGLLLLREDLRDPVLRRRGAVWGHRLAEALGRRLSQDSAQGKRLGWQMASLWQGAHTWWAFTREEPPDQAIRRALEEWIVGLK
ncbi:TetR/AcrR family transcriptional regulator [Microvirga lotononidis]|uniref:Transcriptional regulator n=1 Tax=Microvirga lotononidis TaxID=864069 RepID=I4Z145_9HYPH|nr:TetR family transcriptional regulator [Microvirga lotononidis]EIM29937.1 transcriptional regulator [Microvirga lotononidis]WQO32001.1 TetR family transcriptional regulator [Microvirga lotononidis]